MGSLCSGQKTQQGQADPELRKRREWSSIRKKAHEAAIGCGGSGLGRPRKRGGARLCALGAWVYSEDGVVEVGECGDLICLKMIMASSRGTTDAEGMWAERSRTISKGVL